MSQHSCLGRVLLVLVVFLTSSGAYGVTLANRVFVSARSGNDANACNNINTPCQTFAGAVLQLNPGGEAIVLDSGGYGPVTITQAVTIEAPPGVLAFIHPPTPTHAVTVNAPGAAVVLRGLAIVGAGQTSGSGIAVVAAASVHVENTVITGFAAASGSPDGNGIYVSSVGQLYVKDTIIRGNGFAGIFILPTTGTVQASVDHCRVEGNKYGIRANAFIGNVSATVRDCVISGNSSTGLVAENNGELNAEGCLVANNVIGLQSAFGSFLRASNCTVTDNGTGLSSTSSSLLSRSNNTVQGNTTKGSFTGTYTAD